MKALYRNKKSGDLFAIETEEKGKVIIAKELLTAGISGNTKTNPVN